MKVNIKINVQKLIELAFELFYLILLILDEMIAPTTDWTQPTLQCVAGLEEPSYDKCHK